MKAIIDYQKMIKETKSKAEKEALNEALDAFYNSLHGEQREQADAFFQRQKKEVKRSLDLLKEQIELLKARGKITYEGKDYYFGEWVTLADYARFHEISIKVVYNWIERGIIPQENIFVLDTVNHTKMIKNITYLNKKQKKKLEDLVMA